ncbi:MAG: ferrous iron transport protein B [Anaerolineaceae bacterium]|nr:MAG: ferrous iron transport protein B [Anaerolineaceae bacterium]
MVSPHLKSLSDLEAGDLGVVRQLRGGHEFTGRLAAMGFTPGVEISLARNDGRGPILVIARGTRVALGRGEAARILVELVAKSVDPDQAREMSAAAMPGDKPLVVALAGQPNAGKSTVFNLLTGLSQHVGNWPGKTVEQKIGFHHAERITLKLVDLPGTYSLTANSLEERIARDFILREQPDLVVVIANAASLDRHLYLLSELLALPAPVVLGLNMMDVAEQQGIQIDARALETALGLPVVPMVASRAQGVRELVQVIEKVASQQPRPAPNRPEIRRDHKAVLEQVRYLLAGHVPAPYPPDWVALKLLEGDAEITKMIHARVDAAAWEPVHNILKAHEDAVLAIAGGRYAWIERIVRAAVTRPRIGQITLTERLDRAATHPVWGMLILLGILGTAFGLTFSVGVPLQRSLDAYVVQAFAGWAHTALSGAPWWLSGLLVDGIWAGAGMVLTFVPVLAIFFAVLGVLEDTGYMARAAYVTDRYMHLMGLHGKSFLPLCLGLGCNVPGVLCTRTIESPRARLLTILLAPLVPCAARLAVLAVLAPIFFGSSAIWAALGVLTLNLLLLVGLGYGLHELVLGGEHVAFIMELPLYHRPNGRTIGLSVWQHLLEFVKKAGTIIVAMSALIWLLSYLPTGDFQTGYLAHAGRWLTPLGNLLGLDWRMFVALLTSVVAKENTLATLSILYPNATAEGGLTAALAHAITPAAALAFLVIQMTFIPCVATVAAIKQETRSWKWTLFSVALMLAASLTIGMLVYRVGLLF